MHVVDERLDLILRLARAAFDVPTAELVLGEHVGPELVTDVGPFRAHVPLIGAVGETLGALTLTAPGPRPFSDPDHERLHALAAVTSALVAALELTTLDELTGLANERGFGALGRQALALCVRFDKPVSCVVLALDGLEAIARDHGPAERERALVDFANLLLITFRETDVVARLGHDQFAALLTGTTAAEVPGGLSRLGAVLDAHNGRPGSRYALTFRAGHTQYEPTRHPRLPELLADAEADLTG
ncbi:MAG: GGDEF domain-containing protein [Myxococcota bacterium]